MRKENKNFENTYEIKDNVCLIKNLSPNTNYEIRICSVYNNMIVQWSEIKKVKICDINDSIILYNSKKKTNL